MEASGAIGDEQAEAFPLLWVLGFSGHRDLPDEEALRTALRGEIAELQGKAAEQRAGLAAVSSLARGADLVFAEECLAAGLPWKCLLPFAKEEFRKDEFAEEEWRRAERCLERACRVELTAAGAPADVAARKKCYLDCGHQTVEMADVMLLACDPARERGEAGTAEMREYAQTLDKPSWSWNPATQRAARELWPGQDGERKAMELFKDPVITPLFQQAEKHQLKTVQPQAVAGSPARQALRRMHEKLDDMALGKQGDAREGMKRVLFFHLLATVAAAASVTVFASGCWHEFHDLPLMAKALIAGFVLLVLAKPALAWMAWREERKLHEHGDQSRWIKARAAAEICRGALHCWRFPQAPLRTIEEEDFPLYRRLVRTLRIARECDRAADAAATGPQAAAEYARERIDEQIGYFEGKQAAAKKEHDRWHRQFIAATWLVIIVGLIFGGYETVQACCEAAGDGLHSAGGRWQHRGLAIIAALLVIAPFYASYALAKIAIHDCRRRLDRFADMQRYLGRQKKRLARIKSASSRVAVVENTERMLLEEVHEWHSVMSSVRA